MGFVVRRCFQCSAGKSKCVVSFSKSLSRAAVAFGYFASYSARNFARIASQSARVGEFIISCNADLAFGCRLLGSLSNTLAILCTQSIPVPLRLFSTLVCLSRPAKDGFGWFVSNLKGTPLLTRYANPQLLVISPGRALCDSLCTLQKVRSVPFSSSSPPATLGRWWLVRPSIARTFTEPEAPSFAWRTNVIGVQLRGRRLAATTFRERFCGPDCCNTWLAR